MTCQLPISPKINCYSYFDETPSTSFFFALIPHTYSMPHPFLTFDNLMGIDIMPILKNFAMVAIYNFSLSFIDIIDVI